MTIAIVLASGLGTRMQSSQPKVLHPLGPAPVVSHALAAFEAHAAVTRIVLVGRATEHDELRRIVRRHCCAKVEAIVPGGAERQDSAFNGLAFVHERVDRRSNPVILFHNAANPFVSQDEITACIAAARRHGAAAVAHPATDTIKEVDAGGRVLRTLDRRRLWNMQTPQGIRRRIAWEAFTRARAEGFVGTDDVSLVERLGGDVQIVPASPFNIKITRPVDMELAKILLRKRHV